MTTLKSQVMKKIIIILAMLLIAATAYNQTSRRPANSTKTSQRSTREASATTKRTTSSASQRQSRDVIVKTKPSNRRTYHYDQNTPVKKTNTYTRNRENTQRSNGNKTTVVTTTSTQKTTSSRVSQREYNARANSKRAETNRTSYHKANDKHKVTVKHPETKYHREFKSPRVYRESHTVVHHYYQKPAPKAYRAVHYAYRRPAEINIIWTPVMHRHYVRMYPMVKYWYYTNGYRIAMISAYDAEYYRGEVRTIYGRVSEVFYSRTTDEYFLYFGLYYPYQDFTVVLPGYIARRYSHRPQQYFDNRHIAVTGLITTFNGEPEIVVKESFQINLY